MGVYCEMVVKNSYAELVNVLDQLKENPSRLTEEEAKLIRSLSRIVHLHKHNRLVREAYENDEKLTFLYSLIEDKIEQLRREALRIQKCGILSIAKKHIVLDKIASLNELKLDLYSFMRPRVHSYNDDVNFIITTCVGALAIDGFHIPKFFGKDLVKRDYKGKINFQLNSSEIHSLYAILDDDLVMQDLKEGVSLLFEKKKCEKTIAVCRDAIENKKYLESNMPLLLRYNLYKKRFDELNNQVRLNDISELKRQIRAINKKVQELSVDSEMIEKNAKKIHLYQLKKKKIIKEIKQLKLEDELKERYQLKVDEIGAVLRKRGLQDLLTKNELHSFLHTDRLKEEQDISVCLSQFESMDQFQQYYHDIERKLSESCSQLDKLQKECNIFFNRAGVFSKELLINDFETAKNIVNFYDAPRKNGISPLIALYLLKTILTMRECKIEDMGISREDIESVRDFCHNEYASDFDRFYSEYYDILNCNLENKLKK